MTAAFLVTLRETLEASLLIGVVLGQLHMTRNRQYVIYVWLGAASGVLTSILLAILFQEFSQGFTGRLHYLYEGFFMILGACFVTWMMWWLHRNSHAHEQYIRDTVDQHVLQQYPFGIFMLVFLAVAREGIETIIFLQATFFAVQNVWHSVSAILGILLAIVLAYLLFKSIISLSVRTFFTVVHVLLLFFAAGLVAHGVHELQEAGLIPMLHEHVWDTNYLLDETSIIGQMAKALFGYNGNPSLLEACSYIAYIFVVTTLWFCMSRRKKTVV